MSTEIALCIDRNLVYVGDVQRNAGHVFMCPVEPKVKEQVGVVYQCD